jgi:hypothetical protein
VALPICQSSTNKGSTRVACQPTGRTGTYNPPVNSLVVLRKFNNFAVQMTTHEDDEIQEIHSYVTLI